MPSLKDLRTRINSVKSTRKITSAMKMVAASKLRRAQEQAEAGRPYAELMARMLSSLAAGVQAGPDASPLLVGTGRDDVHLLVVVSADRGLAGGFNAGIVREARRRIDALTRAGKTVKLITVGRKARDLLRRDNASRIVASFEDMGKPTLTFASAKKVADTVLAMLAAGEFDACTLLFNRFKSVVAQIPTGLSLVPFKAEEEAGKPAAAVDAAAPVLEYEYEPSEEQILADLLPQNLAVQVYRALLESAAGEQAARMAAMDNATRNAGDMINRLSINYNRSRQAYITKELIEIISGAEAV